MDHALTFAVAAGLFGLNLLSALLLRRASRVLASIETIRAKRTARSPIVTPATGLFAPLLRTSPTPRMPRPMDPDDHQSAAPQDCRTDEDIFVPAFDAEGNPYPKRMKLEVLLRGVGIGPVKCDPALAVIEQTQSELRAFAELASRVGPSSSEDLDLSELGHTLGEICCRLEIAHELLDRPPIVRGTEDEGGGAGQSIAGSEPPPSEDGGSHQNDNPTAANLGPPTSAG